MAAWLTVFCAQPVDHLTASSLSAALTAADLHTIAEGFGIDDESVVDDALARLEIEPSAGPDGVRLKLSYGGEEKRPVLVHVWDDADRVRTEQEEAQEGVGEDRVTAAVRQAVSVVGIELGWSQLEDMGIVLAGQVAEAFASAGRGLIRDHNDDWWAVENGVPTLLVRPAGEA